MTPPATDARHHLEPGAEKEQFVVPQHTHGTPQIYLCGHSLGLQPRRAADMIQEGLAAWASLAVDGHFEGAKPWFSLGDDLRGALAHLTGAGEDDVTLHASLTTNLHLLLTSFYRPKARRTRLLMEYGAFPSDRFLVHSHVESRGLDPLEHVLTVRGEGFLGVPSTDEIIEAIRAAGETLATVLLPGVAYATGQVYDIARITAAAHAVGATVGFDLAHAIGNIELNLVRDGVDFAAWCSYKYLNGGPGAIGGLFVHPRHTLGEGALPRFEGWWGNRAQSRFTPNQEFEAAPGAGAWQLSNVPVFSTLPLYASLPLFQRYTMAAIDAAGRALHRQLRAELIASGNAPAILTPEDAHAAQLSVYIPERAEAVQRALQHQGILCDTRGAHVLRLGVTPLYTSSDDASRAVKALLQTLRAES